MKKILFLISNYDYPNPCNSFFLDLFKKNFKIQVFGPGFVPIMSYDKTISYLKDQSKKIDLIIVDTITLIEDHSKTFNNSIINFKKKRSLPMLKGMKNFFISSEKKKIFFANFDYYTPPKNIIKTLDLSRPYIIHPGTEFLSNPQKKIKNEKNFNKANNKFYNYLIKNKKKIISFPFYVSKKEKIRVEKKTFDISILGSDYNARQTFFDQIAKKPIRYSVNFNKFNFLIKINKIIKKEFILDYFRNSFRKEISKSWASFTCGGILRYPVRKFFEIPFFSSLLICESPKNFKHLGFIRNKNFIEADMKNSFKQLTELLLDKKKIKKITDNGNKLINQKHTTKYRSKVLYKSINKILRNKFCGSYWFNGNFILK